MFTKKSIVVQYDKDAVVKNLSVAGKYSWKGLRKITKFAWEHWFITLAFFGLLKSCG
jgi:hypothetical protein